MLKPKRIRYAALIVICTLIVLNFSGCRLSSAIVEHLSSQQAELINTNMNRVNPSDEGEEDERFDNLTSQDAEIERDVDNSEGLYDEEQTSEATQSVNVDEGNNTNRNWENGGEEAHEETVTGSNTPDNDSAGENNPGSSTSGSESSDNTNGGTKTEQESSTEPESESGTENVPDPVNSKTKKQVVDDTGTLRTIPDDVESVAAVGAAAQITEMLGADGILIGTNAEFADSYLAGILCPDLQNTNIWWDGDGSSVISDDNFNTLMQSVPDLCIEISGQNTFSEEQITRLENAGVGYIVIPQLSSLSNIKQAVYILGQALSGSSDNSPAQTAQEYSSWCDGLTGRVSDATASASMSSLYISGWDYDAGYSYEYSETNGFFSSEGTGLAYVTPSGSNLISELMSQAHVTNESNRKSSMRGYDCVYVTPLFTQFAPNVYGGIGQFIKGDTARMDQFISVNAGYNTWYNLGNANYPAVITRDSEVADQIAGNEFWQYYDAGTYGCLAVNGTDTPVKYRAIEAPYSIFVSPSGMLSWAEGSAESPLECIWVACKIQNAYSIDDVKNEANNFYEQFFACSVSSDELSMIFGE